MEVVNNKRVSMAKKTATGSSQTKRLLQNLFRIRFWLDAERIKGFFEYLRGVMVRFLVPQPKVAEESFEEAKVRLGLTDEILIKRQKALLCFSIFIGFLGFCIFTYSAYLAFNQYFLGASTALIVSGIAGVLAFRYHFWYYQIKHKKLGCSLREWLYCGLLGGKAS